MQNLLIGIVLIALSFWFVSALPRLMELTSLPANIGSTFTIPNPANTPAPLAGRVPDQVPAGDDADSSGEAPVPAPRATGRLSGTLACGGCASEVELYSAQGARTTVPVDAQGRFRAELPPGDYVAQIPGGYAVRGFQVRAGRTTALVLAR